MRDQISFVLRCLDTPQFIDTLRHKMLAMVKAYELELDISSITEDASKLGLAGTFQQALHQQFTEALAAMFAIVLSHMARPAPKPRLGSCNAPSWRQGSLPGHTIAALRARFKRAAALRAR